MPAVSIIRHPRRISGPCDECAGRRRGLSVAPDPRDRSFGTRRAARRRRATRGRGARPRARHAGGRRKSQRPRERHRVVSRWRSGRLHILVATTATLTIIPAARSVPYDVDKDVVPLGTIWQTASALEVRASFGVRTLAEFIAAAKARPASMTIGSAGVGTPAHLTIELLKREAGIDVIHVPFRSAGESLTAVVGGQIDALFGDVQIVASQLAAGTVRALAVTGPRRVPSLPEVPTMAEAGLPGVASEPWVGYVVSAKTPPAIVKRLQTALAATHDDRAYQESLARVGASVGEPGAEAFARLIKADAVKWRAIIAAAGIRLD